MLRLALARARPSLARLGQSSVQICQNLSNLGRSDPTSHQTKARKCLWHTSAQVLVRGRPPVHDRCTSLRRPPRIRFSFGKLFCSLDASPCRGRLQDIAVSHTERPAAHDPSAFRKGEATSSVGFAGPEPRQALPLLQRPRPPPARGAILRRRHPDLSRAQAGPSSPCCEAPARALLP